MSNLFILCFAQLRKSPNEAVLELEQHTYKRKNVRHFNHYCLCESRISFEALGSSPVIPDSKMDNQVQEVWRIPLLFRGEFLESIRNSNLQKFSIS